MNMRAKTHQDIKEGQINWIIRVFQRWHLILQYALHLKVLEKGMTTQLNYNYELDHWHDSISSLVSFSQHIAVFHLTFRLLRILAVSSGGLQQLLNFHVILALYTLSSINYSSPLSLLLSHPVCEHQPLPPGSSDTIQPVRRSKQGLRKRWETGSKQ